MEERQSEQTEPRSRSIIGISRFIRDSAMALALVAGTLNVASLWSLPLGAESLGQAGRGVLLILLALGLMGSARFSVVLAALFAATAVLDVFLGKADLTTVSSIELGLLVLCVAALILPPLSPNT